MFSSLPKLADKVFVVGYLLPTLLFVCALGALFADQQLVQTVVSGEAQGWDKIVGLVIAVWAIAVLMEFLNIEIIKFLEGYRAPIKGSQRLKAKQEARFAALDKPIQPLLQKVDNGEDLTKAEDEELEEKLVELHTSFPSDENLILPTRFGNAIRSFELYGNEVYGADSVTLWASLLTVIPKDFAAAIGDVKAQIDGLVNVICFSVIFAIIALARALYLLPRSNRLDASHNLDEETIRILLFILAAAVAAALTAGAYALAIRKVHAWGSYVKAAFDCYLPELARKLGFQVPATVPKQKELWELISQRLAYHRPFDTEPWMVQERETDPGSRANDSGSNSHSPPEAAAENRDANASDPEGNDDNETNGNGGVEGGGEGDEQP
jgi:hypothetical protein